jgi:hypothetical protein
VAHSGGTKDPHEARQTARAGGQDRGSDRKKPDHPMPRAKNNTHSKKAAFADPNAGAVQPRGQARAAAVAVEHDLPFLAVPRDEDDWRFAQSFAPRGGDTNAARSFFAEHGFVVFRDVLTTAETTASRDEILSFAERTTPGFDAGDESTWDCWRAQQFGMPPPEPAAWWQPQLSRNRRHPLVAAAYAQILGCAPESLRCSHDRWALYPRGLRTRRNVHLDINPVLYTHGASEVAARRAEYPYAAASELYGGHDNLVSAAHGPHLQGTLTLQDNEESDAGFLCVPGSHRLFDRWVGTLRPEERQGGPRYDFPEHSAYHSKAQRVPVRAGSLIVWDVRLVHGSAPDQSPHGYQETRPRFVQFVTLRTERLLGDEQAARRAALVQRLFRTHGLEEPTNPVQRAVAGLPAAIATDAHDAAA